MLRPYSDSTSKPEELRPYAKSFKEFEDLLKSYTTRRKQTMSSGEKVFVMICMIFMSLTLLICGIVVSGIATNIEAKITRLIEVVEEPFHMDSIGRPD